MKPRPSFRAALLAALLALAACQPAFAGGVSGTPGTLDATLVDPPTSGQYPHFLCSGCSAGGGAVTNAGTFPVQPDGVVDGQTIPVTNGSGTGTNAVIVPSTSTAGYAGIESYLSAAASGASGNVFLQQSFDQTNWFSVTQFNVYAGGTAAQVYVGALDYTPVAAPYFRVVQNGATSGTTVGYVVLKRNSPALYYVNASVGYSTVNYTTGYTDSTTALGSSATFTGTGRSTSNPYSWFSATAYSDQAGTLQIQQSLDNAVTFQTIASVALSAATGQALSVRMNGAINGQTYYRVQFVNGSTAQGTFRLSSAFTAN